MRVFSFGGGVQSTAALVLAAEGRIDYRTFLFANVGEDAEHPATLEYVRSVAMPFAEKRGIELVELHRTVRGERRSLYQRLLTASRSIDIPVRSPSGAPGNRNCTANYKIKVVGQWCKERGANVVGLGISVDESHRARDSRDPAYDHDFPLLDLRLRRNDCRDVIAAAGLPVPPKSSCWFCPYKNRGDWQRLKRETPALFSQAVELDETLRARSIALGRKPVYLHSSAKPLALVVGDQAGFADLDDDGDCDSGYCWR